jgi:tetratricopeptide (TPR) repeat protein
MTRIVHGFIFFLAAWTLSAQSIGADSTGPQSVDSAIALGNLAASYRVQGRLGEASSLLDRAIKILETQGTGGTELPGLLSHAAMVAYDLSETTRAEAHARRALSLLDQMGAADSAGAASARNALGVILAGQAHFSEAQNELEIALALRQKWLPTNDPFIGETLNNLGFMYRQQGRMSEAERTSLRAISILERHPPSSELGLAHNNLGSLLASTAHLSEAAREFKEAIAIWQVVYGTDHPNIAIALSSLATVHAIRHQYAEADKLLQRAMEIDQRLLPAGHVQIGLDLNNAAMFAVQRKHYAEAEVLYRRSLAILEKALPSNHPDTGRVLANLGDVLRMEHRTEESEPFYRRGLAILTQSWGPEDRRLLAWIESYAGLLRSRQNFADAAKLDMQAMRIRVLAAKHSG